MSDLKRLIGQRLKKYREENDLERNQMAAFLDVQPANYRNIERGEQLPTIPQLQNLAKATGVAYHYWLDGAAYSQQSEVVPIDSGDKISLQVPLVPEYAYGGYRRGYADQAYIDNLPKVTFLVDREYKGTYRAFEVRGDSMDDGSKASIAEGDLLLCREVRRDLWQDSKLHILKWNFVIVHKSEGILVKRIIEHNVRLGTITIHSLNPVYSDEVIKLEDVGQIFNVVKVERKLTT